MNRRNILAAAALGVGAALWLDAAVPALAGETQQKLVAESAIEQIKTRGTLRVGLSTFVPWSFVNKDGELIGFEVDVAKKLAEETGVKLDLVPTQWDAIIPSLIAGKYDVIIGGLSITPQRALTVNFTIPYEHSQTYVVVNKKVSPGITTLEQIDDPNVIVAQRRGATSPLEGLFPKAQKLLFDDENSQQQELLDGKVTAVTVSTPTPALLLEQYPDTIRIIEPAVRQTNEAFALRKGDADSLAYFDAWIGVHTADGWLQSRYDYWFKTRKWASQVDPTKQN